MDRLTPKRRESATSLGNAHDFVYRPDNISFFSCMYSRDDLDSFLFIPAICANYSKLRHGASYLLNNFYLFCAMSCARKQDAGVSHHRRVADERLRLQFARPKDSAQGCGVNSVEMREHGIGHALAAIDDIT